MRRLEVDCSETAVVRQQAKPAPVTARMKKHKSSQAVVNGRFYMLFGALIFAAVTGLGSTVAWVTNSPPAPDLTAAQPKGKAVAELTASAYVAGRPLPVPFSASLTPGEGEFNPGDGTPLPVQDLVWSGFERDIVEGIEFERHTFELTLLRDLENPRVGLDTYQLIVPVIVPTGSSPVLGALPYLTLVNKATNLPAFDYGGASNLPTLPQAIPDRLEDWARYWAADDRARLQASTPDGDTTVEYVGLGGFESSTVEVLGGVPLQNGDWLIRARIELNGPTGFTSKVDMDITMTDTASAAPLVVAWGPAGSGVLPVGHNSVKRT